MPDSAALVTIRELKAMDNASGRQFTSVLVVRRLVPKTASNGNPFLSVDLGDSGGSFSCTIFNDSPVFEPFRQGGEGSVVRVEGKVDYYQGRLSPRITRAEFLTEQQLAEPGLLERLVECSPEDPAALWRELEGFIESIKQDELRMTVRGVLDELGDGFKTSPAAVSMHHAYRHGLLEHTVHMARACRALLPVYPEVDPDLAMAGVILHDVGKAIEYEGTLSTRRGRRGILQGHVVLGYQLVRKAGLKARLEPGSLERLEHIILSHQGELEWGAAVYAATPEAVFVAKVDDLDAKMGMVQRALRVAGAGEEFTERLPGLNGPLLIRKPGKAG